MSKESKIMGMAAEILDMSVEQMDIDRDKDDYDNWDSLSHVQIAAAIVDEWNVVISAEDLSKIRTLSQFLDFVEKRS